MKDLEVAVREGIALTSRSIGIRVGSGLIAVIAAAVTAVACTNEPDNAAGPMPSSSVAAPPPDRPACQAALPAAWQQAIERGKVDAGGSAVPLAVGRAGEVVAVRDNGDTRDLLFIGADKSVREIYPVPDPNRNDVGFAAIDDRWIVVGVDRIPRNSNGVLPTLTRIDVIDRKGGPVQNVVQAKDDDFRTGGATIDSVALFDGKVYWTTHDKYADSAGTTRSYDPDTGTVADVASGSFGAIRATAVGLTGIADGGRSYSNDTVWERTKVMVAAPLPKEISDALGAGPDRLSLVTDGKAYAWLTGVHRGITGVALWSPESGPKRVTGDIVGKSNWLPPVWMAGPYVVIERGHQGADTSATVVDTRSGAVTYLNDRVAAVDGGTITFAMQPGGKVAPVFPSVVRADELPALSC
jgi:hypothetical protein